MLGAPLGHQATRGRVGFLPEHFRFHDWLTGQEFLTLHGRLHGLNGVALNQTTSATVGGNNNYGSAYINRYLDSYQCADPNCNTYQYREYKHGYAQMTLNTVTMSLRNTNIPEPGSLALLGLGLSGLAFVRRRKALS